MRGAVGVAAVMLGVIACWLVGTATAQQGGIEPTDADLRQAISHHRQATARVLDRKCLPNPYRPYQYKRVATIPAGRVKPIERTWGRRLHTAFRVHSVCNSPRYLAHRWAESWAGRCVSAGVGVPGNGESGGNIRSRSIPSGTYRGKWQMNMAFERAYGPSFVRRWGRADNWPEWAQDVAAWRGWQARGWSPWPNTARMCGLL